MTESWNDLQRMPAAPKEDRLAELCAEVFSAPAGKALLGLLHARHVDRSMNPLAEERALRVLATEQHFVRELELACERGLKANAKPK